MKRQPRQKVDDCPWTIVVHGQLSLKVTRPNLSWLLIEFETLAQPISPKLNLK